MLAVRGNDKWTLTAIRYAQRVTTEVHPRPTVSTSSDGPARPTAPPRADRALRSTFTANIALAVLAVITGVFSARLLHPAGEGELTAIQTWPMLLGTLAMLGLDSALVYFIARQPGKSRQFTSTATLIGLISSLIVGAAAWFALPYLLSAQQPSVISAARIFLLIGVIYALVGIPHGALRGAYSFTAWNLFRVAPGLAWLCILLTSWLAGHPSAIPLSRFYLCGTLLCGLPFLITVNRKLSGPLKPDVRFAPSMLRFGLPSALTSLPQSINLRFDQMLIIAFLPARSLGLYVIAVSWSGAVAPSLTAVGSVLFPHVSGEKDADRRGRALQTALQGGGLVALATSVPFMLLAPMGLPLVFGAGFAPSVPSALVLVPAGAVLAWAGIAEEGLRGLGRPGLVLAAEVVAAVVTVSVLPVLLHRYGIVGAAVASLLGYSTIATFTVVAISRSTNQRVRSLVIPTWPVAKSLTSRSVRLAAGWLRSENEHRLRGRHRSSARRSFRGRRRLRRHPGKPAGRHNLRGPG
jgi:O-antigen/teichoic acid export membrane protein